MSSSHDLSNRQHRSMQFRSQSQWRNFVEGGSDPVDFLVKQHIEIEDLAFNLTTIAMNSYQQKNEMLRELTEKLKIHTRIEESCLYPCIKDFEPAVAMRAAEEHEVIDHLLTRLDELDVHDVTFDPKLSVLVDLLRSHIQEEEDEIFPLLDRNMDWEGLQGMGKIMHKMNKHARVILSV